MSARIMTPVPLSPLSPLSFTMEASFAGPSCGRWSGQHFTACHLEMMGAALLSALLDAWDPQQYGEHPRRPGQLQVL